MPSQAHSTVVLFSIDGMRPDALQQADTPCIDRLIAQGAACMAARTVMPCVTLPCHTSMLRGVDTPRHGITSNVFQPLARPVPSLLDVAHAAGMRTGFFYNWGELRDLCAPDSLDVGYFWQDAFTPEGDQRIARAAVEHIGERPFDLLFVYLGHVDECGHKNGWMSPDYLEAIGNADRCVGSVLDACHRAAQEPITLVLSDHGGHGRTHGEDIPEDMTIPWILAGPGVRPGALAAGSVRIYDTCTTLAATLGLAQARQWDGRVVTEAIDSPQPV